ncbi:MAG: septum site-determining protein MinC [Coxiellaceae bacterium]|nr:septum site-determining protein MinC [Coxiellaceae bacterium]
MLKASKNNCFQLKADFLPITTLKLSHYDAELFRAQLESTILKAPHYFTNAPVIIDFSAVGDHNFSDTDLKQLSNLMREYQMIPVAARGLAGQHIFPNLPETAPKQPEKAKIAEVKPTTKIVTKPVRAGTQVYAKDADLVIVAPVNAGAEVIADGNIHIYGSLRGRALAGANGNVNARIFCHDLDAELISIAGHYLLSDQMQSRLSTKGMAHVFLDNETMQIEMI